MTATSICQPVSSPVIAVTYQSPAAYPAIRHPCNQSYYVDWCHEPDGGARSCGQSAADAFCALHGLGSATSWQRINSVPPTKLLGSGRLCETAGCNSLSEIVCNATGRTEKLSCQVTPKEGIQFPVLYCAAGDTRSPSAVFRSRLTMDRWIP